MLRKMGVEVVGMEDYGASDERPLQRCLTDVGRCDIYLGIFAWRYGFVPDADNPDRLSITELELREAVRLRKPRLLFLLEDDYSWPPPAIDQGDDRKRIDRLRGDVAESRMLDKFTTPADLAGKVSTAVHNWLERTRQASATLSVEQARPRTAPISASALPREVSHDVLLAYAPHDADLADALQRSLAQRGRRVLAAPRALFADDESDF